MRRARGTRRAGSVRRESRARGRRRARRWRRLARTRTRRNGSPATRSGSGFGLRSETQLADLGRVPLRLRQARSGVAAERDAAGRTSVARRLYGWRRRRHCRRRRGGTCRRARGLGCARGCGSSGGRIARSAVLERRLAAIGPVPLRFWRAPFRFPTPGLKSLPTT